MDPWQIEHLRNNKMRLIELTTCNSQLFASLQKDGVLSHADIQQLESRGNSQGGVEEASLLYDILRTKKRGYEALNKALYNCNLTGAFGIILEGFGTQNVKNPFEQCGIKLDTSQFNENIVLFQGREQKMKDLFDLIDHDRLDEILKTSLSADDYTQLSDPGKRIILAKDSIPKIPSYYVKRELKQRKCIDPKLFSTTCPDIFVFKGISRSELSIISGNELTGTLIDIRRRSKVRFVWIEHDYQFDEICKITSAPTHLIHHEHQHYILVQSRNGLGSVNQYLKSDSTVVNEDEFIRRDVFGKGKNICISATPGMGKSMLLAKMANEFKVANSKNIAVFTTVSQICEAWLSHSNTDEGLEYEKLWAFIIDQISDNNVGRELLYAVKFNICLFLDGFDEVLPSQNHVAERLLKLLVKNGTMMNIPIVVTTRPHFRSYLETLTGTSSFTIAPFSVTEQVQCVERYLQQSYHIQRSKDINRISKRILHQLDSFQTKAETSAVTGIPMMCTLIAEAYSPELEATGYQRKPKGGPWHSSKSECEDYSDYYRPNDYDYCHRRYLDTRDRLHIINLQADLYSKSLAIKFSRYEANPEYQETIKRNGMRISKDIYNAHIAASIELLFPDWMETLRKYFPSKCVSDYSILYGIGIIEQDLDGRPRFIHKSYAEYLLAEFLVFGAAGNVRYHREDETDVAEFIFSRVFSTVAGSESIFKINHFGEVGDKMMSFEFLYPNIASFMNGILENSDIKYLRFPKVSQELKNINLFFETTSACLRSGYNALIGLVRRSFLSGDMQRISLQISELSTKWDELIFTAVKHGNKDVLKTCLNLTEVLGIEPIYLKQTGKHTKAIPREWGPLHLAAEKGDYSIFEFLFKRYGNYWGFEVSTKNLLHVCVNGTIGNTPKQVEERIEIIKYFLGTKFDKLEPPSRFDKLEYLNANNNCEDRTLLLMEDVHVDILMYLVEAGADISVIRTKTKENMIHIVSKYLSVKDFLKLLTHERVLCHLPKLLMAEDQNGSTPLHVAIEAQLLTDPLIHFLQSLKCGILNDSDSKCNLLQLATKLKCGRETIQEVIKAGFVMNCQDGNEVHFAVLHDNTEAVETFVAQGIEVQTTNSSGETPINLAVRLSKPNYREIVKFLLKNGGGLNDQDRKLMFNKVETLIPAKIALEADSSEPSVDGSSKAGKMTNLLDFYGSNFTESLRLVSETQEQENINIDNPTDDDDRS